jgi:hypothetical protein
MNITGGPAQCGAGVEVAVGSEVAVGVVNSGGEGRWPHCSQTKYNTL